MFGQWNTTLVVIIIVTVAVCGALILSAFDLPTLFIRDDR
jgi:hypothetical protein